MPPLAALSRQFAAFAAFGVVGTAGHYATLWGLVENGLGPVPASAVGFLVGALINYLLSRRFIFHSAIEHRRGLPKFLTVAGCGLILNTAIVAAVLNAVSVHYLIAQALATVAVLVWNFAGHRLWTFQEQIHVR